jgi:hypothetical protein
MDWTPLQLDAKAKGTLVFAMRQGQLPIGKIPIVSSLTTGGFCLGLSISWIAAQYDGDNFSHSGQVCDWPPIKAALYQVLAGWSDEAEWTDRWKDGGALEQLTLSSGLRGWRFTRPSASFIYSIVTKAYGCYGVTLWGPWGVHAVALRHAPDNRMHFFDPNYGHFVVKDHTKLKDFLGWFFSKSDYRKGFADGHAIIGIKPPIGSP